jgi:WD40 repeat protein
MPYRLSASLLAHSSDVRIFQLPHPDLPPIRSFTRRSKPLRLPQPILSFPPPEISPPSSGLATVHPASTHSQHAAPMVDTYTPSPSSPEPLRTVKVRVRGLCIRERPFNSPGPDGRIVTGHHDTLIRVWSLDPTLTEPLHILNGHSHVVSALDVEADGTIISGSWDSYVTRLCACTFAHPAVSSSAKVWRNFEPIFTLAGHTHSVLAVHALGSDEYLTGKLRASSSMCLWHLIQDPRIGRPDNQALEGKAMCANVHGP